MRVVPQSLKNVKDYFSTDELSFPTNMLNEINVQDLNGSDPSRISRDQAETETLSSALSKAQTI